MSRHRNSHDHGGSDPTHATGSSSGKAPGPGDTGQEPSEGSRQPETQAPPSLEQLQDDLEAARQETQETFARYQRLWADFENYKRRTRQELIDRTQYANAQLMLKLLPLLDNLRRAIEQAPKDLEPNWFEGIRLIARQFEATLEAQGLATIPAVGEKFDPTRHEAIAREETDEHEEGTVVEEMQRGYRLHERVLRPTLVKVAQPRALQK